MVLKNVTVARRADISHGGRVSARTVITAEGEMKSLGIMQPGVYHFTTDAPQLIEVLQGHCRIKLADDQQWSDCEPGQSFAVPARSHFEIEVVEVLDYLTHIGTSDAS